LPKISPQRKYEASNPNYQNNVLDAEENQAQEEKIDVGKRERD